MLSCRGSTVLSLLVVLATASTAPGTVSCGHKSSEALDAASDASSDASLDAAATSDASSAATGGGSIASDAGAAAAAPSQVVPIFPRPTPFSGTYRCFKGMQLEQAGNIVTATMHKDSTTDTVVACTAVGETCTGTMRDIQGGRGKVKKVVNVRPVTLQRTAAGDILFNLSPAPGAKSSGSRTPTSTKSAAGDQTFCPRR